MTLEIVGSCEAYFMEQQVQTVAAQLGVQITSYHTLQNHPISSPPSGGAQATARLVVPPLRYMHHDTLDDIVVHPDHRRLFEETRAHLVAYLDSVLVGHDDTPHFVTGFVEPCINPLGVSFHAADLSNLKFFVRCLNDVIIEWCDVHAQAWYIDANETASMIGKNYVDDGPIAHYAHRIPFDPYDDWVERDEPVATVPLVRSFDIRSSTLLRGHRPRGLHPTRRALRPRAGQGGHRRPRQHAVAWPGLRSGGGLVERTAPGLRGGAQGAQEARCPPRRCKQERRGLHPDPLEPHPAGLRRGAARLLAQPGRLRRRAHRLPPQVGHGRRDPRQLNIGADSAVFVDDNPLEREEVQAAFPAMRISGAELNYVRRELLFSPFTQRAQVMAEDANRSSTVRQHALLEEHAPPARATTSWPPSGCRAG